MSSLYILLLLQLFTANFQLPLPPLCTTCCDVFYHAYVSLPFFATLTTGYGCAPFPRVHLICGLQVLVAFTAKSCHRRVMICDERLFSGPPLTSTFVHVRFSVLRLTNPFSYLMVIDVGVLEVVSIMFLSFSTLKIYQPPPHLLQLTLHPRCRSVWLIQRSGSASVRLSSQLRSAISTFPGSPAHARLE